MSLTVGDVWEKAAVAENPHTTRLATKMIG
jgi:hypothetical protein